MNDRFLTIFGIGNFKQAPGTWGSLAGLILGLPILYYSAFTLFLAAVLVGILAIRRIDKYESEGGEHDDSCIVIDELVGMWFAMSIAGFNVFSLFFAFVFFRIYDIWKPSIIGKIDDEIDGGIGVVGDDALAGIVAGITALLFVAFVTILGFDISLKY